MYVDGKVLRTRRKMNQFKEVPLNPPEHSATKTTRGYMRIHHKYKNKKYTVYEHRVIFAYIHGVDELFKHECIHHMHGIRTDNRIENLRGLSIKENTLQAERIGLYKRTYGELNGMHKLTTKEVEEIRSKYKNPYNQYELSEIYGISQGHVSEIINHKKR